MNRRWFLQFTGAAVFAAASFPRFLSAESPRARNQASPNFHPDVEIDLTIREVSVPILPARETRVIKYYGKLVQGPEGTVKEIPGSYLGPTFNLKVGQKVRISFHNGLGERGTVHWHGLHVPQTMDGHPMYAVEPGETYVYEFTIIGRAGTFWYHSHAHEWTGEHIYKGLADLLLVSDSEEQGLRLPDGQYDIPLVIQDRSFDGQNQLRYLSGMHEKRMGFLGERILVNGRPDYTLPVATRAYRLRLLNGSNSRIYKLAWSDGTPMIAIATEGGLLAEPVTRSYITLGPAERTELWVDFSKHKVGDELVLKSLAFTGATHQMGGMMDQHGGEGHREQGGHNTMSRESTDRRMMNGGMEGIMHGGELPLGSEFTVLKVRVEQAVNDDHVLPRRLAMIDRLASTRRKIRKISASSSYGWTLRITGRSTAERSSWRKPRPMRASSSTPCSTSSSTMGTTNR
jgi:suppressor of ftsI